jgi:subtilisin family serine protease
VLIGMLPTFASTGNKLRNTYKPFFFNGFSGDFTPEFITEVRKKYGRELEYVEKDGVVKAFATLSQPNPPSWGLARISTRALNLGSPYVYPATAGRGINVYVVDTGVQFSHTDFGGRASLVKTLFPAEVAPDGNGHGTHCSGTIASTTYGVAKLATIKGVKALSAAGSGTYEGIISAIEFGVTDSKKVPSRALNTVMSMSLGGPTSKAVNDAVDAAIDNGVVAIVAAGNNSGGDACTLSPAGASKVLTVGSTDKTDTRSTFSNIGKCVEVFAPGTDIKSLWKGANGATNTISGTSMATPHVAGIAALYMADKAYTKVQDVYNDIIKASTKNLVKNQGAGSPNTLGHAQNIAA